MDSQVASQRSTYEKSIQHIMRRLPTERLASLVEFARFLEFEVEISRTQEAIEVAETASANKWDELLAKPESKNLLRKMAHEAQAEYLAGESTEIKLANDDRLSPA